jgi:hypothetical protein
MVRPQQLIQSVLYTLKTKPDLPEQTTFVGFEPDIDSQPIDLPMVEVSPNTQVHVSESNTDFIGMKTDDEGREIGRIYESLYTLDVDVAVWTAQDSKYSPRNLMDEVRDALYTHDTAGPDKDLRFSDGSPVDEVWRFSVLEGEQTDDLTTSPILRRWTQNVTISASERYVTDEDDPISGFNLNESPQ